MPDSPFLSPFVRIAPEGEAHWQEIGTTEGGVQYNPSLWETPTDADREAAERITPLLTSEPTIEFEITTPYEDVLEMYQRLTPQRTVVIAEDSPEAVRAQAEELGLRVVTSPHCPPNTAFVFQDWGGVYDQAPLFYGEATPTGRTTKRNPHDFSNIDEALRCVNWDYCHREDAGSGWCSDTCHSSWLQQRDPTMAVYCFACDEAHEPPVHPW